MSCRASSFIGLLVLLAGCAYDVDVEYSRLRLVPSEQGCPDAAAVATEARADSAELVDERRIPRAPLCWYRVEETRPDALCGLWKNPRSLEEMRAEARSAIPRSPSSTDTATDGVRCTTDGPVLLLVSEDGACAPTLDGYVLSDFGFRRARDDARVKELLARDERSPLTMCRYEIEDEVTRRPFSCSRSGGALGN